MAPKKGAKRKSGKTHEQVAAEAEVHPTHEEAVQGAELASGVEDKIDEIEQIGDRIEAGAGGVDPEAGIEHDASAPIEEVDPEDKPSNSVVKDKFKTKYIENAKALGVGGKAAKRSNWDWLSQQIAAFCLDDKAKISISRFTAILDANGVDHSKWTNRNKGWEGRFRMTGRVALQKVVANAGTLHLPGIEAVVAPETGGSGTEAIEPTIVAAPPEWCALYKTKSEQKAETSAA